MTSVEDEERTVRAALEAGEMAARIRAFDWSASPLGPMETWSPSLSTTVSILLANRFPLLLWWGPDHIQIYNDAYRPVLGTKHPRALGQPARECWPEIWDIIGPLIETPYGGGPPTWDNDLSLEVFRHGFLEETHFTVAYSPVPDDAVPGGTGGVLATVHETTKQVVQERRLAALRDLGARSSEARSAEEACAISAASLAEYPRDVPFALLYLIDAAGSSARLAGAGGVEPGEPAAPDVVDLADDASAAAPWPLRAVALGGGPLVVEDLNALLPAVPPGPWPDPPRQALVLPVSSSIPHSPAAILVMGLSPYLEFDDDYRSFADLVMGQIAAAIANARAYAEERKRAETLLELDRAKTAFFNNISHEFRTPLTLLLGPLEEALSVPPDTPVGNERVQLEEAHRNSLRLLRLVNTLLDFSRIEAGRVDASFEPTDLATLTADLASVFRAATERAGLRLEVECPPLAEPVYVDRDMWEKIVLNLLSNAFKFTLAGDIVVTLKHVGEAVELTVRDTGVGIPAEDVPLVFDRFHRVQSVQGRSHEGSGIGLSLVKELVGLHGGTIEVSSEVNAGTSVKVCLPLGIDHLPADRIGNQRDLTSTSLGAIPFVEEALRWLPDGSGEPSDPLPVNATALPAGGRPSSTRVLLADDNADMREYLRRLLEPRYDVEAVPNGTAALASAAARPPDLVLADIMMPGMDGFDLLRELRSDPRTHTVPIVLLSARAGEEAIAAGLAAGADDYLVKPFAAGELLARVQAHIALSWLRREATAAQQRSHEHLQMALAASRTIAWEWDPVDDVVTTSQGLADIYGIERIDEAAQGFPLVHPDDRARHEAAVRRAVETGENYRSLFRLIRPDSGEAIWLEERGTPVMDASGVVQRVVGITSDVTARARDEAQLRQQADLLALSQDAIIVRDPHGRILRWNEGAAKLYGWTAEEAVGSTTHELLETRMPLSGAPGSDVDDHLDQTGAWHGDLEHARRDGTRVVVESRQSLLRAADGTPEVILEVNRDASERERLTQLHQAAVALSSAGTVQEVAEVIIEHAREALGAHIGVAASLSPDGSSFNVLGAAGYSPEIVAPWSRFGADASVPLADAVRVRKPLILESLAARREAYPHLAGIQRAGGDGALVAIPLLAGSRAVGALGLTFATARRFTAGERAFMQALGGLCAQALDRARLHEVERRARAEAETMLGQIADGVMVIDLSGRTTFLNDAATALLGVDTIGVPPEGRAGVYGLLMPDGTPFQPDDLPSMRAMRERQPIIGVDMLIRRRDGREFLVQENAAPVIDENEKVVGAVATLRDVSAERELERQKEDFLSAAAHDLRTPLTSIRGYAQLAQRRLSRSQAENATGTSRRSELERIISGTDVMLGLIDELMDVTRLEMGALLDLQRERSDLVALVREAVSLQKSSTSTPIELDAVPVLYVEIDTARISRVVSNLLSNAVKYSPSGSPIKVEVARQDDDSGAWACISIQDSGLGIPADDLPYIFDRFARARNVVGRIQGSGVGLASARGVLEQHGGTIEVESEEGVGSTFTIRLPLGPV